MFMFVLMNVAQHISDLIYRHECVILPGIGAFVSRRVPAHLDRDNNTIYPPKKYVGFNPSIQESDGLLINYVASAEGLSYEAAAIEVENFVIAAQNELDDQGFFNFSRIGQLKKNSDGVLQFTAVNVINYLPEAFGLSMQSATPVSVEYVAEPKVIPIATATEEEVSEQKTSVNRWWKVAAAIAVICALGFFGNHSYQQQVAQQDAEIAAQAAKQFQDKVQESTFTIAAPLPAINIEVQPLERTHHIIAGAFRNPANADKRVAQLKAKGYNARHIGVNKYGLHNVAFASFVERDDAINELYRLRKQGYDSAWLFTGTLK
jgi:hypothetical protein